ncbi:MAG TPA: hypothetical protein DHW22_03230, partial [Planctomycetaceae bacterium]|nr:hypothetical protein [Planctomycetaceae bacterium]
YQCMDSVKGDSQVAMAVMATPTLVRSPRVASRVVAGIIGGGLLVQSLAPSVTSANRPTGSEALWIRSGDSFGAVSWTLVGALLFSVLLIAIYPHSILSTRRSSEHQRQNAQP